MAAASIAVPDQDAERLTGDLPDVLAMAVQPGDAVSPAGVKRRRRQIGPGSEGESGE
jgi:hypothetical protein